MKKIIKEIVYLFIYLKSIMVGRLFTSKTIN